MSDQYARMVRPTVFEQNSDGTWKYPLMEPLRNIARDTANAIAESVREESRIPAQQELEPLDFFTKNVDAWGAAEWFNRLALAIRQQDAAVVAGDEIAMEICRNVAASSAMRLVREYEQQVRTALSSTDRCEGK